GRKPWSRPWARLTGSRPPASCRLTVRSWLSNSYADSYDRLWSDDAESAARRRIHAPSTPTARASSTHWLELAANVCRGDGLWPTKWPVSRTRADSPEAITAGTKP